MSRVQLQGTNTRMNEKRTIIITGAASGIGLATAQALLGKGHRVAIVDVNEEAVERCRAELLPNDNVHIITASASDEEGAARAVAETTERFGRIEVLFNNAGIGVGSLRDDAEVRHPTIEELTPDDYLRFFGVNVLAAVTMTRACIASLKSAPWGRIINNTTSYMTMHRVQPYGATKSGLESVSAVWADELKDTGITVNVVVPGGPTDTPMVKDIGLPRQQMLHPGVLTPPIDWLISTEADGVTGRRFVAGRWDISVSPAAAAAKCARSIGWPELTGDVVWHGR
jgi:NAD(P)-dependent dehydrogenase (short-subunit alcohol dehydrogenase family)